VAEEGLEYVNAHRLALVAREAEVRAQNVVVHLLQARIILEAVVVVRRAAVEREASEWFCSGTLRLISDFRLH
jgi:hypothetical protein